LRDLQYGNEMALGVKLLAVLKFRLDDFSQRPAYAGVERFIQAVRESFQRKVRKFHNSSLSLPPPSRKIAEGDANKHLRCANIKR